MARKKHQPGRATNWRKLMPREDDMGYAIHLAAQLRVVVLTIGDQYVVEKRRQVVYEASTVRGIVSYLQKEIATHQLQEAMTASS